MADKHTVARPYAQAVFDLAQADSDLAAWSGALKAAGVVVDDPQIAGLIDDPRIGDDQLVDLLQSIFKSIPEAAKLTGKGQGENFLRLLIEFGRLNVLPEIAERFDALKSEAEHVVDVTITSASAIDDAQKQTIISALKARLGYEINATTATDEDLIGGAVIRAGDFVIDGSVRAQLDRLSASLAK